MRLVIVVEDGTSEILDIIEKRIAARIVIAPSFVVFDIFHDVAQEPLQHRVAGLEVFQHHIYRERFHLNTIDSHLQIGSKVQFACKVAQHTLEKGIDGLYAKLMIVMDEQMQGNTGTLSDDRSIKTRFSLHLGSIALRVGQFIPNTIELAEDTLFHLFRSLIGKGHGKNLMIVLRIRHQQFDVFGGKCKGLTTSGTRLIDGQRTNRGCWICYHFLKSSKVNLQPIS